MAKRVKQTVDANDLEVYPTVAGFEVALRKEQKVEGVQYFEIVLRSIDRTTQKSLLLTDKKRDATRRLMDYHAGCCAMQHIAGIAIDRRL